MDEYRKLLHWVDDWYRSVQTRHADQVTCTRGCRDCCVGLFDVTLADRDLLREGMTRLPARVRRDIEARAAALLARLRERYPQVGDTLEGCTEKEIDAICAWLHDVECPALGKRNECRLYEHRPLTCRLHGVPVVDLQGKAMHEEGCAKCRLTAAEAPRLDCARLCRLESKVLRTRYGDRRDAPILIPQALAPERPARRPRLKSKTTKRSLPHAH